MMRVCSGTCNVGGRFSFSYSFFSSFTFTMLVATIFILTAVIPLSLLNLQVQQLVGCCFHFHHHQPLPLLSLPVVYSFVAVPSPSSYDYYARRTSTSTNNNNANAATNHAYTNNFNVLLHQSIQSHGDNEDGMRIVNDGEQRNDRRVVTSSVPVPSNESKSESESESESEPQSKTQYSQQRRIILSTITTAITTSITINDNNSNANAVSAIPPLIQQLPIFNGGGIGGGNGGGGKNPPRSTSLSIVPARENSTVATALRQLTKEPTYDSDLAAESCLLELLPVKNKEFRTLEKGILKVSILRDDEDETPPKETYDDVSKRLLETLQYLDDQRNKLAPVFNMDDSTTLSIEKATRGETLLENLRKELVSLLSLIQNYDVETNGRILQQQKRTLRALAEVGELLVDIFPYDVPTKEKFSFLPRLLGRAKITFTIVRPATSSKGRLGTTNRDVVLGNVTILADGFAAPITAGNFVDLSARGFYTGLPVKAMKKRLGARPTLTMAAEDNIVAYDIASTVDKLTGEDSIVQKAIDNVFQKKETTTEDEDDLSSASVLSTMPIMGSFNEGFYDPLTAKPRRLPLEVVQFDRSLKGRAKLSYESGFSPSINTKKSPTSSSALMSVLNPVVERATSTPILLTFDIPGLVAMNHPDKNLNGASSEFFVLTEKDLKPERASLLNGQYAPFGYVIEGQSIMNDLQAGDVISATYVNEWGKLNLKKIRGTSFANAMSSSSDDDDDNDKKSNGKK